jgi:putative membrane protein
MMGGHDGFWGAWGGLGVGLMVLVWLAVLGLVAWAVVRLGSSRPGGSTAAPPPDSARSLLDQRLARGEIDAEEYARVRRLIEGRTVPDPVTRDRAK